ncbi:MAG: hypothetical protein GX879_03280 [Bacteroidales bacterium]|nr:hypothetical protein [Bacteroidales bacterium]
MHKFASIDLGTNTCNILIAEYKNNELKSILTQKRAIMLLKGMKNSKFIQNEAINRLKDVINEYSGLIHIHQVDTIIANATSGIRSANNGLQIIDEIKQTNNIEFNIIDGDTEAFLIHKAVKNAITTCQGKMLLLDIGGGSNEFVIFENDNIIWKQSFNLGISRTLNQFKLNDPLSNNNLEPVLSFFEDNLSELFEELKNHKIEALVGSSGTFETLSNIIKNNIKKDYETKTCISISLSEFDFIFKMMMSLNLEQRLKVKGMDVLRVELMPLASLFVNFILNKTGITKIIHSEYSIKEGAIFNFIEQNLE